MKQLAILIATFFGVGRIRIAPGTWTSLIVTLIVYFIFPALPPFSLLAMVTVFVFVIGIPAAAACEKHFQKKDPRQCVIDEVAGQLVCFWFLPHTIAYYAAAFLLFRFFDILKPFPIKTSEQIPHGIGIMLDDVLAGFYALGILQGVRFLLFR
ncbi:MAG: phosphatidylglycerophosphatase A [Candidatus Aminicenantes bacterium]|nr:phosphatidylglycerophosphatase A [Candidatus Aminicenantes bacterium]